MKNLKKFVCNLDVIISGLSLCYICDFLRRKRGIPLRKPGKY